MKISVLQDQLTLKQRLVEFVEGCCKEAMQQMEPLLVAKAVMKFCSKN